MSVLTRVQLNPEIGSDDSSFVTDLVARAQNFVTSYCNFPRFPSLSQGYSQSRASVSTDISGASTNSFYIWLNGSPRVDVALTLANCDSGANIATEMQAQIRAASDTDYGFDEVTVAWDGTATQYTITSGRYGESSTVILGFDEQEKHVCQLLGLTPQYGGVQYPGMAAIPEIEDATVEIVEQLYRKVGVEGLASYELHQGEFNGMAQAVLDPLTLRRLHAYRRLW